MKLIWQKPGKRQKSSRSRQERKYRRTCRPQTARKESGSGSQTTACHRAQTGAGSCRPAGREPEGRDRPHASRYRKRNWHKSNMTIMPGKKRSTGRKPTGSVRTRKPAYPPEITDLPGSNRMHSKKPVPQTPSQGKKRRRTCTGKRRKPCVTI